MRRNRKPEGHESYKSSDRRALSADAKIIVALMKKQPQRPDELCKSAVINQSTFYRTRRLLINRGVIKQTEKGYALWNYSKLMSLWDRLQQKLLDAGAPLIDLKIEKLELGEQDPTTGWYGKNYDKMLPIQGIMILKGAKELQAAASLHVPNEYSGFLLTQGAVEVDDRFQWQGQCYTIQEVEEVLDGYTLSYRIAKLVASS